ncbi:MAG: hypothetical protein V1899_03015 [Planctomycetota bacterium]
MSANVKVYSWHGAGAGSGADITSADVRFRLSDVDTGDTANPVVIPAAGTNYSWLKNLRLYATTSPASIIDNLKFYSDGVAWATGITVKGKASDTYVDPVANGASILAGATDLYTYTTGAPLSLTGSISNPTTGDFGQFVVAQLLMASTASPGVSTGRTYYFRYDEI